ncbi:MAG: DUF1573 domain-containing protein [Verrucomicrobia bacterium]|nr:DUF1573 domain-containing protein [Verrucomicrobiota bacterium]
MRTIYGKALYVPTTEDSQRCFADYMADAQERMKKGKLKPGEDVRVIDNRVQVSGQVAVMQINALLAKRIFDKNPERQFYVEENFPLDWMYPYLTPHQLILKLNREPVSQLTDAMVKADREYWTRYLAPLIGAWLTPDTPVSTLCEFAEKVHVRKDLSGFRGDPKFVANEYPCKMFSKLRSSIAGVYAWRVSNAKSPGEGARMRQAANFAFRQAFALCPYSPEALYRYMNLLIQSDRLDEAIALTDTAEKVDPNNKQTKNLRRELEMMRDQKRTQGKAAGSRLESDPSGPRIQFAGEERDFGRITGGSIVKHDFVFTNAGTTRLELTEVKPSCGCTTAGAWTRQVEPGQTGTIPIQFQSANLSGPIHKSVNVVCNDSTRSAVTLHIKATVWNPIEVTPTYVVFDPEASAVSNETRVVRILNNTDEALTLSAPECASKALRAEVKTLTPGKVFEVHITAVAPFVGTNIQDSVTIMTSSTNLPVLTIKTLALIRQTNTVVSGKSPTDEAMSGSEARLMESPAWFSGSLAANLANGPRLQVRLVSNDAGQPAKELADPQKPASSPKLRVSNEVLLTQADVDQASVGRTFGGGAQVVVKLTSLAAARFAEITQKNVNRQLAIIFDGRLLTAPVIRTPITGGLLVIDGGPRLTDQEAQAIADALTK